jgi:membrane-associated protease RseP (regulator of RpoE activity)
MSTPFVPIAESDPVEKTIESLATELKDLFQIEDISSQSRGHRISFEGKLLTDSEIGYDVIRQRFKHHGYTPLLKREKKYDIVVAMEGLVEESKTGRPTVNVLLLVVTVITTLSAGASLAVGFNLLEAFRSNSWSFIGELLLAGLPFAATLLGILGVHELGHYVAARRHNIPASLPYFIPLPFGLGTLGALISIKSPMKNRRVLFDIGLAGPYAGLLVAVPMFLIGLLLSSNDVVPAWTRATTLESLGSSIFSRTAVSLMTDIPAGQTLQVHPILFAAWWGIFITGINLLPVGQLDGGHVVYALFGRFANAIGLLSFLLLIIIGSLEQELAWFVLAFLIMLGGLRHPPPLNDIAGIGRTRKIVGYLTIILFVLIFIPQPF